MHRYIVFAGVNGAGKTTLYQSNPKIKNMPRVNVDEIVRSFGNWDNAVNIGKAGKLVKRHTSRPFKGQGWNIQFAKHQPWRQ